ncbi:MAG: transcription antitermination factor NusB [Pseudomonadota bacterium]
MGKRHRARELAMQVLFHLEFNGGDPDEVFGLVCDNFNSPLSIRDFARKLLLGVCNNKEKLDSMIKRSSKNWRLERMSHVDRNILRLATCEILCMSDIPPKVSINEAVELGKRYGNEDSGAFINGILDDIYKNLVMNGVIQNPMNEDSL